MTPTEHEQEVLGVVQGFQGAAEVLFGLRSTFGDDAYLRLVSYLYHYGPRGPRLYERYRDRCNQDVLVLGKDLLAQLTEIESNGN